MTSRRLKTMRLRCGRKPRLQHGLALFIATAVAQLGLVALAPTVRAECLGEPARPSDVWLGVAFVATVRDVYQFADNDYTVDLEVTKIWRGEVPDQMVLQVRSEGCTVFRAKGLAAGDRVFFAMDRLTLPDNESLSGPLVIWRKTGGEWRFADDALHDSFGTLGPNYWSRAMRDADSLSDILAAISGQPDTATASPVDGAVAGPTNTMLAWLAAVVAFVVALLRLRSGPPRRSVRVTFSDAD